MSESNLESRLELEDLPEATALPVSDPFAELPDASGSRKRASLGVRVGSLIAVIVPFCGIFVAAVHVWGWGLQWIDLGLLFALYFFSVIGITVGFHRLFTHRSFETTPLIKFFLGVFGSMAVQGPLLKWVAVHRRHHQFSDMPNDPHSPHHHGTGIPGLLRGLWHSHLGWLFEEHHKDLDRYVKDLTQSRMLNIVSRLFPLWVIAGILLPAVIGGILTQNWMGVWTGLIWGGLVRIFLVHHVTWSINSVCHLWGSQPYRSEDESRNNALFGVLGLGEGWHHSHHVFPSSARHGLRWWQLDVSYIVIRMLSAFGLAWNIKVPSVEVQIAQQK